MNEWINEQVHERLDELVKERMNKCINECYVVLCCAVLSYGQSALTFYMCLESLVGCMEGILGSCTYFSADGTILRTVAKYFEATLKQLWSTFEAMLEQFWSIFWGIMKQFWSSFEAMFK